MIFVTLGTQDKSFHRLLEEIERAIKKGIIQEEVIVQAGVTKFESKYMKVMDLIPREEFEELIANCDLLITHGGVGSILTGLEHGKKVIAVPRLSKYKEHTNDHQVQIVEEFAHRGYLVALKSMDTLPKTLKRVEKFKPKRYESNNDYFISQLEQYIEGVKKNL